MDGPTPVGVVGVGTMGSAFARHLAAAGLSVVVHDIDAEQVATVVALGCTGADSAAAVASRCPVVVLSLPSATAFAAVVDELAVPGACRVVVDTSTLPLAVKEAGRDRLHEAGVTLLDCTVSGTGSQALQGDVVVYASGPDDALDRVEPVLSTFARGVHRVGAFGAASRMKFLANLVVGVHTAAAAEMLALARRCGVDPAVALDAVLDGAGASRMLAVRGPGMVARTYDAGAAVRLWRKDVEIIEQFAADAGASTPLLRVVAELFARADAAGWSDHDAAAVHEVYLEVQP